MSGVYWGWQVFRYSGARRVIGASGGIGAPWGCRGVGGHYGTLGVSGCQVYGRLAGTVGTQGPEGV